MSGEKAMRPQQVSLLFADAFETVDSTTGAALDEVKRRAESAATKSAAPPRRTSDRPPKPGRFFLLVRNCTGPGALGALMLQVQKVAKVIDSGIGVASDKTAGWLEVACRAMGVMGVREKLTEIGLNEQVEEVLEIAPGQGRLQAKQIRFPR